MTENHKQRTKAEIAKFFSTIEDFGHCETAVLRTVLIKTKLGGWACIGLIGSFKTDLSPTSRSQIFKNNNVFIEERVVDVPALKDVIETLIKTESVDTSVGSIRFGGPKAKLRDLRFKKRAGYTVEWDEQFGSVTLEGYAQVEGGDLYDSSKIDLELQSGREPYNSLGDLTFEKTGKRLEPSQSPSVVIRAPRYMKLEADFEEDEIIISLKAHKKTDLSQFKLSVIVRGEDEYPALMRTVLPLTNPNPYKDELVKMVNKLNAKDAKSATIFLFQGKELLDVEYLYKGAKTMRSIVHQHLDPDFRALESWVRWEGKDKSSDFEWGLSLLLSLLGFSVEWVGSDFEKVITAFSRRAFGVDTVAHAPGGNVVILGQCTTTSLPSEKVSQLKLTANEIKSKLGNRVVDIIPTIFTILDEDDIKDEIEKLKKENILVIGSQGLENLLNDVRLGTSLQNVIYNVFRVSRAP